MQRKVKIFSFDVIKITALSTRVMTLKQEPVKFRKFIFGKHTKSEKSN